MLTIDTVHQLMYYYIVKKRDLEQTLRGLGWWQVPGGKHDKWTNGVISRPVPRHVEINEYTARGIIRVAAANPPEGKGEKR